MPGHPFGVPASPVNLRATRHGSPQVRRVVGSRQRPRPPSTRAPDRLGYLSAGRPRRSPRREEAGRDGLKGPGTTSACTTGTRRGSSAPDPLSEGPGHPAGLRLSLFNLAVVERARGRWNESLDLLFRSFAAGHPAPERTILQWAWSATEEHRPEIAISLLEKGIAAYPRSEEIGRELGRRRFQMSNCKGALSVLAPFRESGDGTR